MFSLEAGMAIAFGKKLIFLYEENDTPLPFGIENLPKVFYKGSPQEDPGSRASGGTAQSDEPPFIPGERRRKVTFELV